MKNIDTGQMTRRAFAGATAFMIVPRHVLGVLSYRPATKSLWPPSAWAARGRP